MKDRRIATFSISLKAIEDDADKVRAVMAECIVLRAETMWHRGAIEYTAISPRFNELKEGEEPPIVTWFVEDGKVGLLND